MPHHYKYLNFISQVSNFQEPQQKNLPAHLGYINRRALTCNQLSSNANIFPSIAEPIPIGLG